jgi:hypothetical protein
MRENEVVLRVLVERPEAADAERATVVVLDLRDDARSSRAIARAIRSSRTTYASSTRRRTIWPR